MILIAFLLIFQVLFASKVIHGQCTSNGTCVCHCGNCTSGCDACLPGWSGSTINHCQKYNTIYGKASTNTALLDGDFDTYVEDNNIPPYIRVEFQTFFKLSQVDVTLELAERIIYTVYVKNDSYRRADSMICLNFTSGDVSMKKTVTVTCNTPLQGNFFEIVASSFPGLPRTTLKVFEIERFECSNGTYGENCSEICSAGCNKECDKETGDCVCRSGYWGSFCNRTCPLHCNKNLCDSNTGDCYSCDYGYYGVKCEGRCAEGCLESCNMTSGLCFCKLGFYSANCSLQCQSNCARNECVQETGHCKSCNDGKYGDFCDLECFGSCSGSCDRRNGICGICGKHRFDTYCNQTCPNNCEEDICDRVTGECKICLKNTFGTYCNQTCPKNCEEGLCDRVTGKCDNCLNNTFGTYCDQTCPVNCETCDRNGEKCTKCKKGYMGDVCSKTCPDHCGDCNQDGYICKTCENGWFGIKCETNCGRCGGNGSCDITTGDCHLCYVGYFGNSCKKKCNEFCDSSKPCNKITGKCHDCKPGQYGEYCTKFCSRTCRNLKCFSNQTCVDGCADGFFGSYCDSPCSAAVPSCNQCELVNNVLVCQRCADPFYLEGSTCIECPDYCSSCSSGLKCLECKTKRFYGDSCNITCNKHCLNMTCDITGQCQHGCDDSKYGSRCDKDCPSGCRTCHNSSVCLEYEDRYFGKSGTKHCPAMNNVDKKNQNEKRDSTSTLIAVVVTSLMIFATSTVVFVIIGQMKQKWKKRSRPKEQHSDEPFIKRSGHIYENAGLSVYNIRGSQALLIEIDPEENTKEAEETDEIESPTYVNVNMTHISLKMLWKYKLQNTANDVLDTEFKSLPSGLLLKSEEAKKSANKKKNRYKSVYPYDTNRVVLSTDSEMHSNKYINASYINGVEAPKEYIAAQGPFTDETVADIWRMVWHENVNTIVILTNLEENGVKKCKKYWPSTENMYGDIQVKTVSSVSSSCYKVRLFQLTMENEVRTVEQFHFTAWPDKGVPSTVKTILEFRKNVRNKADIRSPVVVHCSAGIGRTGTFIALDYLINQGQKDGKVDVVSCVSNLRYQRTHLVQTVEQYIYLYSAVTKELTGKESGLKENEFMKYYSQMKRIDESNGKTFIEEEFNLIEKLGPIFDEKRYQTAKALINRHKNRHSNILADDSFRIHLNRQDSDYINAIALPSAQQKFGYIITNTPFSEIVDDFFSMVADHNVYTIVQLDNDADEVFGTRCQSKNETFPHNTFELKPREKNTFGYIEVLTCHLQDDHALISRNVELYQGRFWNENHVVPKDFQPMMSLVEEILNKRRMENGNPVVVVCRDGAQRSGLFCVLANLVEQIQLSGSVDILQTVLNVRHRRPQIVPCLEQLEYIYDFIKKYLESGNKV
ncbi:uncharacterized protein LOC128165327 [Crassostrea angulata]|uniref:uncharacterized protein LOC128165327 n=1 Tax=Magallana angulata TaxID=2784310 RepID=UPI0022B11716|nr:uncharacterized protein LOC128165327 [Crassostrea angulata]